MFFFFFLFVLLAAGCWLLPVWLLRLPFRFLHQTKTKKNLLRKYSILMHNELSNGKIIRIHLRKTNLNLLQHFFFFLFQRSSDLRILFLSAFFCNYFQTENNFCLKSLTLISFVWKLIQSQSWTIQRNEK